MVFPCVITTRTIFVGLWCSCSVVAMAMLGLALLAPFALMMASSAEIIVQTKQGALRGKNLTTARENVSFVGFLGVRYAEPPVGALRFQAPIPISRWTGTKNATEYGSKCIQIQNKSLGGDEDCLFLNVFTKQLPSSSLRPVMVWIHGGEFVMGSAQRYGPDYFILEDVVVVTINYRIGALGYLSLLHPELPGNAGPKDQVLALKWVQQNIALFGGDPNSVTIFGQSSGGVSVHSHMLSPMSKGLFHRAISQSGTMMCFWAVTKYPVDYANRLAKQLNCSSNNVTTKVDCLKSVSAEQILEATSSIITIKDLLRLDVLPFGLVVDGQVDDVQPFLPDLPVHLLQRGQFQKVPYMAGTVNAEALFLFSSFPDNQILPTEIMEYLKKSLPSYESFLITKITEMAFIWPTQKALNLHSKHMTESQHYYYFTFEGQLNIIKNGLPSPFKYLKGASHLDDPFYMFHTGELDAALGSETREIVTLKRMVQMWANFAKASNPTPLKDSLVNVSWPSYSLSDKSYLIIDDELTVKRNLKKDVMMLWDIFFNYLGTYQTVIHAVLNPTTVFESVFNFKF